VLRNWIDIETRMGAATKEAADFYMDTVWRSERPELGDVPWNALRPFLAERVDVLRTVHHDLIPAVLDELAVQQRVIVARAGKSDDWWRMELGFGFYRFLDAATESLVSGTDPTLDAVRRQVETLRTKAHEAPRGVASDVMERLGQLSDALMANTPPTAHDLSVLYGGENVLRRAAFSDEVYRQISQ